MKASSSDVRMTAWARFSAPDTTTFIRAYFSLDHILGAAYFARQSFRLEALPASGTPLADVLFEHRACVMGAVLSSTAFLEAAINEVFADAADERSNEVKKSLPKETVNLLADGWRRWQSKDQGLPRLEKLKDRHPVLRKYQLALDLAKGKRTLFPRGEEPYQSTGLLLDLRNALTHPVPETSVRSTTADSISGVEQSETASEFESSLGRTHKFAESALFASSRNAYFPYKCLGHGCAEWSVKTARKFADDFYGRIGLPRPLDAYEDRLRTQ